MVQGMGETSAIQDHGRRIFVLFLFYHCKKFVDVNMTSPSSSPPLYGSSRITGGSTRGHAVGNVFNFADAAAGDDNHAVGNVTSLM